MLNIAVLVSGGGTNLQALLDSEARGENPTERSPWWWLPSPASMRWNVPQRPVWRAAWCAAGTTTTAKILTRPCWHAESTQHRPCGAGRLSVGAGAQRHRGLSAPHPQRAPGAHPVLLRAGHVRPAPHEAALARGCKVTGATVHFVNEECDGGPILLQKAVDILPGDTPGAAETGHGAGRVEAAAQGGRHGVQRRDRVKLLPSRLTAPPPSGRLKALPGAVAAGDWGVP